ncbi:MAG: hypothetical protein HOC23_07060 [Halieaceae bacterium]|jgi:hypothetical protein|nr:hypothetical protein [Halieaceae bacterium]
MKQVIYNVRRLALICMTSMLFACASTSVNYSEYMKGQWDTQIQGFPVVVEFTESTVGVVGFGAPIPYTLEGNTISFDFQGLQVASIDTVDKNEMTHTNVNTQAVTTFKRKQ